MPATSIFMSALSSGISGMGNSRISVLPGPVLTAASTFSIVFLRFCAAGMRFLPLILSHPSWPPPRPFRCAGQEDESDRRCQFFHCSSSPLPIRCKKLKESLMKNRLVFSLIGAVLVVLPILSQADESPFSFLRVYKLADGRRISISVPGEWREL